MGPNAIAEVVNGNLDDSNIDQISGVKISTGTLPVSASSEDANIETRFKEALSNFIASGMVWSSLTGRNAAMTSGIAYVEGKRLKMSAIPTRTFTASKDTYIYVTTTEMEYIEVENGAAVPATPAGMARVARVATNATAITATTAMPSKPVGESKIDLATFIQNGFTWLTGTGGSFVTGGDITFKRPVPIQSLLSLTVTNAGWKNSDPTGLDDPGLVIWEGPSIGIKLKASNGNYTGFNYTIGVEAGAIPSGRRVVYSWTVISK